MWCISDPNNSCIEKLRLKDMFLYFIMFSSLIEIKV